MAQAENNFSITGYLKENTLELLTNDSGISYIRGNVTIATSENQNFKVSYYAAQYKKNSEGLIPQENKTYAKLLDFLPGRKSVSLAELLQSNPNMSFEEAKGRATLVRASGSLQEYLYKDESGTTNSIVTFKGIGLYPVDLSKKFTVDAKFKTTIFIESKTDEYKDNELTGRINVVGLIPEYDGTVSRISFVTGTPEAASYVGDNYEVNQTVTIYGNLISMAVKEVKEAATSTTWGETGYKAKPVEVSFIHERQIMGGDVEPKEDGDDGAFTKKEIAAAKKAREAKIAQLTIKSSTPKAAVASKPAWGMDTSGNLDF